MVGPRQALACAAAELSEVNWLGDGPLPAPASRSTVKHRAQEPPVAATLPRSPTAVPGSASPQPQHGVAPGQACVFYQGTRVLGGGWIERAPRLADA